jgi:hypothetical protein
MRSPPTLPRRRGSLQPDRNWLRPKNRLSDSASAARKLAAGSFAPAASGAFFEGERHHLPHSVSCLSSIENIAPSFTSTFFTMQTRFRASHTWVQASGAYSRRAGRYCAPCRNSWRTSSPVGSTNAENDCCGRLVAGIGSSRLPASRTSAPGNLTFLVS